MTSKGSRRRRGGRGALLVIAALLLVSGLIRLGNGTGRAVAREVGTLTQQAVTASPAAADGCDPPPDIAAVLTALQDREARVAERETDLAKRRRSLDLAKEEVTRRLAALEDAESQLRETVALADKAAEKDVSGLTKVYESMKPKEAAALFEQMAPDFAAGFLGRMRPDAAAAVMAGLSPPTAYSISVILAGRNADIPGN